MFHSKISIGINGSMLDDKPTGVGVYSFNLINNLSLLNKREFGLKNFTVFTPSDSLLNSEIKTVKLSRFLLSSKYGKIAAASRFLWNTLYYPFWARKFDVLISPTTHGSFLLKNQIITIHDLLSLRYNNISFHQRLYFKYALPYLIKKARLLIAVSENTKKDIVHFFNCPEEKIKVVYNGFDETLFFPDDKHKNIISKEYGVKNYLLAVGPTYPHKNFRLLIQVYNELPEEYKQNHPLIIAGGKEKYLSSLKELVNSLQIENYVFFLGYVPLEFMPALYREAFVLIFPSLYEGFGIPLLEAMACGCPVIASNTSSIPEVCGGAVMYFDPSNRFSLKASIQQLSSDYELRDTLIAKGIARSKKFSWMKMAKEFNSIIEKSYTNI